MAFIFLCPFLCICMFNYGHVNNDCLYLIMEFKTEELGKWPFGVNFITQHTNEPLSVWIMNVKMNLASSKLSTGLVITSLASVSETFWQKTKLIGFGKKIE